MKRSFEIISWLRKRFSESGSSGRFEEQDQFFIPGESTAFQRDRTPTGYRDVIEKSLKAWREDPLARRIVSLTTQFSVGRGFRITADDPQAEEFLHEFWEHPLNRMDMRLTEWSDELCRTGNLFIMISSDVSGMSYVRAIPAGQIEEIIPQENDIEQPSLFRIKEYSGTDPLRIPGEREVLPASLQRPEREERMLHFTVNRPVGGQWGEPDLAPILIWLDRYNQWLEDRVRLNHYRNCFIFVVKAPSYSAAQCVLRQQQLNMHPPAPGTILVTTKDEEWEALHPNLDSAEANEDGFALKKVIAAGAGIPVSFLAETGSASKAESGGMEDSACRNFRQRQQTLMVITETVLRHVLARGALVRRGLDPSSEIHLYGDDIAGPGMNEGGVIRAL